MRAHPSWEPSTSKHNHRNSKISQQREQSSEWDDNMTDAITLALTTVRLSVFLIIPLIGECQTKSCYIWGKECTLHGFWREGKKNLHSSSHTNTQYNRPISRHLTEELHSPIRHFISDSESDTKIKQALPEVGQNCLRICQIGRQANSHNV